MTVFHTIKKSLIQVLLTLFIILTQKIKKLIKIIRDSYDSFKELFVYSLFNRE